MSKFFTIFEAYISGIILMDFLAADYRWGVYGKSRADIRSST
ncbi:MAG: hypothetical protein ACI3YB_05005 [Prevotella sp.]